MSFEFGSFFNELAIDRVLHFTFNSHYDRFVHLVANYQADPRFSYISFHFSTLRLCLSGCFGLSCNPAFCNLCSDTSDSLAPCLDRIGILNSRNSMCKFQLVKSSLLLCETSCKFLL